MTETTETLADKIEALGLTRAAEILAEWLTTVDPDDNADGYTDGIEDAILTLVKAGATAPR